MWSYQQRDPWPYLRGREYQTVSKPIFVEFLTLFIRSANSEKEVESVLPQDPRTKMLRQAQKTKILIQSSEKFVN